MTEAGLPLKQAEAIVETFAGSNDALLSKTEFQSAVDKLEARLTMRIITAPGGDRDPVVLAAEGLRLGALPWDDAVAKARSLPSRFR